MTTPFGLFKETSDTTKSCMTCKHRKEGTPMYCLHHNENLGVAPVSTTCDKWQRAMTAARLRLIRRLMAAMWEKLNEEKNISKGDNWGKLSRWQLLYKIREEKDELIEAIMTHKPDDEVIGEIADVANYLAMLLDNIQSRQENGDSR